MCGVLPFGQSRCMAFPTEPVSRRDIDVDGVRLSYLHAGRVGMPTALLLHGTFWSRVWQPVLPALGQVAECVALDLPGFGRSDGELTPETASVPALASAVVDAADALGFDSFVVIGHDIGGGIAQHLAVHAPDRVSALGLVNAVVLDSWPVPAVEKFQDPDVRSATGPAELLEGRRQSMGAATQRELTAEEVEDYLSPWRSPERVRSFTAMAAAADPQYTLDLVDGLRRRGLPTLLVWGEQDSFQKIEYAEKFLKQIPNARLNRVPGRHIPQEDSPEQVGSLLHDFVAFVTATRS
jgi:pimeloyl-ACP methyl ester carboxylesterase